MGTERRYLLIGVAVIALGALVGGQRVLPRTRPVPSDEMADNHIVRGFVDALQVIDDNYGQNPDKERLTKGAVLGMLHSLDPHSNFFDRHEFTEMQDEQSSRFYGIGVTINQRNGRIYVLSVSKGMPAEKAGLRYGDAILEVDGRAASDWSQSDALKYVRGERGAPVDITVERLGEPKPIRVRLVRTEVPLPSVRNAFMIRPRVGYIGLTGGFNQTTSEELRGAIAQLKPQGLSSLVLDLRRNPGGVLKQAIQVAQEFLPKEMEIVTVRGREGRRAGLQTFQSKNSEPESMPLVVLINHETASASEIVAGAIQDKDRGLIVGEESFGKGLVQTVFPLPGGTGLTLTTGRFFTPSGRLIQRPYNGLGFYDYYSAYHHSSKQIGQSGGMTPAMPRPTREDRPVYTPTGRELHGGGGITPDIVIKTGDEDLRLRDACFEFARRLVAGLIPGLEQMKVTGPPPQDVAVSADEYTLPDQALAAFRIFVRDHPGLRITDATVVSNADYARRRLRAEAITAIYGVEAAEQFLLESDEQALSAIDAIPRAKRLTDMARLFQPGSTQH
jgi:carboxyl-terminal processing protease